MPPALRPRSSRLNCPGCGKQVADGTAICPSCDYILDTSFLSAEPPELDEPEAAPAPQRRPAKARPSPSPSAPPLEVGPGAHPLSREEEIDRRPTQAEELVDSVRDFVSNLSTADKLAFFGAVLVVVVSFLPWKETAKEGEIMGVMSFGVVATLAALGSMGAHVARVRQLLPQVPPLIYWALQLGLIAFCVLWCLVFIKVAWNGELVNAPYGSGQLPVSRPAIGVFVGLVAAALSATGAVMGLRDLRLAPSSSRSTYR
jgi:hypothetical protein